MANVTNGKTLADKSLFLLDMDGVIYHGHKLLPGAKEFITTVQDAGKSLVFITNASDKTPQQLSEKLGRLGIPSLPPQLFLTSAIATAEFVSRQKPGGSAFVIGDLGLSTALSNVHFKLIDPIKSTEIPDYVIIGETQSDAIYNHSNITIAINYVLKGSFLIGTNKDVLDNAETGYSPGCGALLAPIQTATGQVPYFLGKPNPIMMNLALEKASAQSGRNILLENTVMIGDRMDTDIIGGIESGLTTILVFSGISKPQDLKKYSYSPSMTFDNLNQVLKQI